MHDRTRISQKWVKMAEKAGACRVAIRWLREKPRTWGQLKKKHRYWHVWAMWYISDTPIDLKGLGPSDRARVMIKRKDCPIDLTGLDSRERAWVMAERKDCPIDLKGLWPSDRARVMANRPDYKEEE